MFLAPRIEKLKKMPFLAFLRQIWLFLNSVKKSWDDPPRMTFFHLDILFHIWNYLNQPKNAPTLCKNPAKIEQTWFLLMSIRWFLAIFALYCLHTNSLRFSWFFMVEKVCAIEIIQLGCLKSIYTSPEVT